MMRIKAVLILRRNATRDYLDFLALAEHMGPERVSQTLGGLDDLYPQTGGESALQQLQVRLANPMPYDLDQTDLAEYRRLHPKWHDWERVQDACAGIATELLKRM